MSATETELDLLESIHQSRSNTNQRSLARIIGVSLGMTNGIVKRLAQRGLIKIKKINNRNLQYIVSKQGLEEIARRSYRYIRRTMKYVVHYREAVEVFLRDVQRRGYRGVLLVGNSDLDFIVEHVCSKVGLEFRTETSGSDAEMTRRDVDYLLVSETESGVEERENCAGLHSILMDARFGAVLSGDRTPGDGTRANLRSSSRDLDSR